MLNDVKCLCGAEFPKVDLSISDGWFTCPRCKCTTKPYVRKVCSGMKNIPVFDMATLGAAFGNRKA